jgi:hypothetical protein
MTVGCGDVKNVSASGGRSKGCARGCCEDTPAVACKGANAGRLGTDNLVRTLTNV